jgi:hypothetical protein
VGSCKQSPSPQEARASPAQPPDPHTRGRSIPSLLPPGRGTPGSPSTHHPFLFLASPPPPPAAPGLAATEHFGTSTHPKREPFENFVCQSRALSTSHNARGEATTEIPPL